MIHGNRETGSNVVLNPAFVSSKLKKGQHVNGLNVDKIVEIMENLGYECKVGSKLRGTSGIEHPFDFIATRNNEIIVADIVSFRASILDAPTNDSEVIERIQLAGIQIRAKGWDCGAYQSFIIYLSSYFSAGDGYPTSKYDPFELFLKQNNIKVVKSVNMTEAANKLRDALTVEEPY